MDPLLLQVVQLLALAGLTIIVTRGWIFYPLRRKFEDHEYIHAFIRCPLCFGAWAGFFGWLAIDALRSPSNPLAISLSESVFVGGAVSLISAAVGGGGSHDE